VDIQYTQHKCFDATTESFTIDIGGRLAMLQPVPNSGDLICP